MSVLAKSDFSCYAGPYVYLSDGYGSYNVYEFTREGNFTNRTFGGRGSAHGKFNNPHAITYDPRTQRLAVTDRLNARIEIFDFDPTTGEKFSYQSTVTMAGIKKPCNFRILENADDPVTTHGHSSIPLLVLPPD
jgi:hypothetical protein